MMVTETMTSPSAPALIVFSHGSLVCGAARAVEAHAARLRGTGNWAEVRIGWMNYDAPTFAEAVQLTLESIAVKTIVVAPYFLVAGRFVTNDLRKALNVAREAHPGVAFIEAAPLGTSSDWLVPIAELVAVASPLTAQTHAAYLAQAIAACEGKPRCPLRDDGLCTGDPHAPTPPSLPAPSITAPADDPPALLLIAHGSPREAANAAVHELSQLLQETHRYAGLHTGFLDCAQPDIPAAAHAAATSGARTVIALPLFLHTGRHVILDLPEMLLAAAAQHPHAQFHLAPFLGSSPAIASMLAARARAVFAQPE